MDCKKIRDELVFLYADNEMEKDVVSAFRRHVAMCPQCQFEERYIRRLLALVRQTARPRRAPQRLRVQIITRIRGTLQ